MTYKTSTTIGTSRKIWNWTRIALFALILPIILLLTSLEYYSYNRDYYQNYQEKYKITRSTGRSQQELNHVSEDIINYLKRGDTKLLSRHFNEREVAHMKDVYQLYAWGRFLRNGLAIIAAMLIISFLMDKRRKLLFNNLAKSLVLWWILLVVLGIGIMTNFNGLFMLFHHLFFNNDLWLLNPKTDWMIRLLPESFFLGIVLRILSLFLLLLALAHGWIAFLGKEKNHVSR